MERDCPPPPLQLYPASSSSTMTLADPLSWVAWGRAKRRQVSCDCGSRGTGCYECVWWLW